MTENEKNILKLLFKDFTAQYNARSMSKHVSMTPRGTLKALKLLEQQNLVCAKQFGNAIQYVFNFHSFIAQKTIELLLAEEAEQNYKRWLEEFNIFEEAKILLLFGSITKNKQSYRDIDVVIVIRKGDYPTLRKKIEEKNKILFKKIHPVIQTPADFLENIQKKDPVILDAIRTGIALKGGTEFVEVMVHVTGK
jgi:predicted nucleotidyltransferase